jgi:hypothetical protein
MFYEKEFVELAHSSILAWMEKRCPSRRKKTGEPPDSRKPEQRLRKMGSPIFESGMESTSGVRSVGDMVRLQLFKGQLNRTAVTTLRNPSHGEHHSEAMANIIPRPWRTSFRGHGEQHSKVMANSIPT